MLGDNVDEPEEGDIRYSFVDQKSERQTLLPMDLNGHVSLSDIHQKLYTARNIRNRRTEAALMLNHNKCDSIVEEQVTNPIFRATISNVEMQNLNRPKSKQYAKEV
jgi:hypothetical protein